MTVNLAMVVVASRAAGLSISRTNISRVYREYHKAQITSNGLKLCGRKCLVYVRGQRSIWACWWETMKHKKPHNCYNRVL